jgi:hypothetical protein
MKTENMTECHSNHQHPPKKSSFSFFGANVDNTVNNINYHGTLSTSEIYSSSLFYLSLVLGLCILLYIIYLARKRLCLPKPSKTDDRFREETMQYFRDQQLNGTTNVV